MHTAAKNPPLLAGRALGFERTVITVFGSCPIAALPICGVGLKKVQFFACWTDVDIALRFIAKAIRAKELGAVIDIRQRNVSPDVLIFESDNVLFSAVFGIPCHVTRPQLPTEAGAP